MKKTLLVSLGIAILLISFLSIPIMAGAPCDPIPAVPIMNDFGVPPGVPGYDVTPKFIGNPATPNPIPHVEVPQHPFMSSNGNTVMHVDSWSSSTYEFGGPLGENPQHSSTWIGVSNPFPLNVYNVPMTIAFDELGRVVTSQINMQRYPKLLLLDPDTLDEIAQYQLPGKNWDWRSDPLGVDTAGGAYCFLDHNDRITVATNAGTIDVIQVEECGFKLKNSVDISHLMYEVPDPSISRDLPSTVQPDWNKPHRMWFTSRYGRVGYVNLKTGAGAYYETPSPEPGVEREFFQNSFAVAEDGIYVVSDYAMYRFNEYDGEVRPDWRTPYEHGDRLKPGSLSTGSGTTVTLTDELVIIGDNADPQVNILFIHRDTGELLCSEDVFTGHDDKSACEVSAVAFQHADEVTGAPIDKYSVIVTNNYGFDVFNPPAGGNLTEPGVTRIDVEKVNGIWTAIEVWNSDEISYLTVPKLSFANGLLYLSTKDPHPNPYLSYIDAYYFTAVDFRTGETVYKTLWGTGVLHCDIGSPITISPDGVVYIGTIGGMNMIRDDG